MLTVGVSPPVETSIPFSLAEEESTSEALRSPRFGGESADRVLKEPGADQTRPPPMLEAAKRKTWVVLKVSALICRLKLPGRVVPRGKE
jgi:hypothetical protein